VIFREYKTVANDKVVAASPLRYVETDRPEIQQPPSLRLTNNCFRFLYSARRREVGRDVGTREIVKHVSSVIRERRQVSDCIFVTAHFTNGRKQRTYIPADTSTVGPILRSGRTTRSTNIVRKRYASPLRIPAVRDWRRR